MLLGGTQHTTVHFRLMADAGTGGAFFPSLSSARPNSAVRQNHTYGVLRLALRASSYDWQFVAEAGKTFTDSGSAPQGLLRSNLNCRASVGSTTLRR